MIRRLLMHALLPVLFAGGVWAQAPAEDQAGGLNGAEDLLSGVVRVKMKAIPGARSSETLGSEREGTGVLIDERGHVLTIGYVVIESESIEITMASGRTVPAILAGYDHASGFGLLRALAPLADARPIALGDASALAPREPVMVLPWGGREAAHLAYVVSRRRFTGSWEYLLESAIFTSPPTQHWAGAALLDRSGRLVGIGSLFLRMAAEDAPVPGNMFVPVDELKPILADLIRSGRRAGAQRPWLGLATETLRGRLFVTRVSPDSPADKAGLRQGDIVVGVGREPVSNHEDLYTRLWALGAAGVEVPLRVLQGVELKDVRVQSIDRFEYFREKRNF